MYILRSVSYNEYLIIYNDSKPTTFSKRAIGKPTANIYILSEWTAEQYAIQLSQNNIAETKLNEYTKA